jgi:hypothetical protein
MNLFTGVSLMPFLLLIMGMYGWFWYTVTGLALFNQDRPLLPSSKPSPQLCLRGSVRPSSPSFASGLAPFLRDVAPHVLAMR